MKLIGMLDSPYVRRVAISLQLLDLPFEHQSLSVFRNFDDFRRINPVVKAPTLVCDDGTVLLDSTLILEYAEALARPRSLLPVNIQDLMHELRLVGLALAACEKSVQIVYEHGLRPPEKRHAPWVDRVTGQLLAAFEALEAELRHRPLAATSAALGQGGITVAVTWHFTQRMLPDVVPADRFVHLAALSREAEALPAFMAAPHGDGVVTQAALPAQNRQ
jgi:glutathione S-transferase